MLGTMITLIIEGTKYITSKIKVQDRLLALYLSSAKRAISEMKIEDNLC